MKISPKTKALFYNFICFAILFIIIRLSIDYVLQLSQTVMALISAIAASILAPKFGVVNTQKGDKILMKWIFIKKMKEVK
ncbi:hypothetical protein GTQ40_17580 [Flavobacteriaceae bacterium R38]|nr:hypothetical protein [Flavobacteriaceae bacterium R38]